MKDSNENPLPDYIDPAQVFTSRDFLEDVHHPAKDIDGDAMRFGQRVFEAYRRAHGCNPYTVRFRPSGPVKVYLESDRPLLQKCYAEWHERQRRRNSAVKDTND